MRLVPCLALVLLLGCSRNQPVENPSNASAQPRGQVAGDEAKGPGMQGAGSFEKPVMRCGPRDSYAYVANEFQCSDHSNPFKGQLEQAAQSRLGSRRHPNGHHIDQYKVPCAGGDVMVFIDMYGCAETQALLNGKKSAEFEAAARAFDARDYKQAALKCAEILDSDKFDSGTSACMGLIPAAMILSGAEPPAMQMAGEFCSKFDKPSNRETVRQEYVKEIGRWLSRGGKGVLTREQFEAIMSRFVGVCSLGPEGQGA